MTHNIVFHMASKKANLGVNAHIPSNAEIDKLVSLGAEWIRLDFDWRFIEVKKGVFSWTKYDAAINYAKQKGLKIYATLAYVPSWVNSDYRACPDTFNWVYFCTKVAVRYNSKIDVYSIGNEPNLKSFFHGTKRQYIDIMLKGGYKAIKSVNSSLVVAAADLSTASKSSWNSWFKLLAKNKDYFDVFSFHVYGKSVSSVVFRYNWGKFPVIGWIISKWRPLHFMLEKIRKDLKKPIFLTETGLKAKSNKKSQMKKQRKYVQQIKKLRDKMHLENVFLYDLQDYPQFSDKWGLFADNGNPKFAAQWLMSN